MGRDDEVGGANFATFLEKWRNINVNKHDLRSLSAVFFPVPTEESIDSSWKVDSHASGLFLLGHRIV